MAQKVRVDLVDDIDGTDATQTVPFTVDGAAYEIDLSDDNAARLREEFAPFIAAGRRTGGRTTRSATPNANGAKVTHRPRAHPCRPSMGSRERLAHLRPGPHSRRDARRVRHCPAGTRHPQFSIAIPPQEITHFDSKPRNRSNHWA